MHLQFHKTLFSLMARKARWLADCPGPCVIHCTKIYQIDNVIQLLNNWGLINTGESCFFSQ